MKGGMRDSATPDPILRALDPFFELATSLRQAGFAVSPDQTQSFIAAIGLLGPHSLVDVDRAARAVFAIPPERLADYLALFRAIFWGQAIAADADGETDETEAHEATQQIQEIELETGEAPTGEEATSAERLSSRTVAPASTNILAAFERAAPKRLPHRRSYRRRLDRRGDRLDLRRSLRLAARSDGDVLTLPKSIRKARQRRILCLIDVSGSMKERSDDLLAFAHALVQAADRAEVFTLGTRLTRITDGLRPCDRKAALSRAARAIADLDGGTRIGDALQAYLAVPRYLGFARGTLVLMLSDGLERGDPAAMVDATRRLSRLSWQLHWLTPLAADPGYNPQTAAMQAVLPWLDALSDGNSLEAVCGHVLKLTRAA